MTQIILVSPLPDDGALILSALARIRFSLPVASSDPWPFPVTPQETMPDLAHRPPADDGVRIVVCWHLVRDSDTGHDLFGVAYPSGQSVLLSLAPLESPDRNCFADRVAKVCLHELGHLAGLVNCVKPCCMNHATSPEGIDHLPLAYCDGCTAMAESAIRARRPRV